MHPDSTPDRLSNRTSTVFNMLNIRTFYCLEFLGTDFLSFPPATTFFNLINLQYSTISEFCTGETCQAMTACST